MIVEMSLVGLRSGHEFAIEKTPLINAAQKFVKTEKVFNFYLYKFNFFRYICTDKRKFNK